LQGGKVTPSTQGYGAPSRVRFQVLPLDGSGKKRTLYVLQRGTQAPSQCQRWAYNVPGPFLTS
ncbi:hypothetical protein NDU88_000211, partial [Pleurodeles waltl]